MLYTVHIHIFYIDTLFVKPLKLQTLQLAFSVIAKLKAKKKMYFLHWLANVTSPYIHRPCSLCVPSTFKLFLRLHLNDCSWCSVIKRNHHHGEAECGTETLKLALDLHYLTTTAGFSEPELTADLPRMKLCTLCTSTHYHAFKQSTLQKTLQHGQHECHIPFVLHEQGSTGFCPQHVVHLTMIQPNNSCLVERNS